MLLDMKFDYISNIIYLLQIVKTFLLQYFGKNIPY